MYGINGKPIIELDQHIDVAGFNAHYESISKALAVSVWQLGSWGPGVHNKDISVDQHELEMQAFRHGVAGTERLQEAAKDMTFDQRRRYLKLRYGVFNAGQSVYLRAPNIGYYENIDVAAANSPTANIQNFEFMYPWFRALPFKEVGRILFFLNEHKCPVVEHSDLVSVGAGEVKHGYEFVWLRPQLYSKPFYVLNEKTGERHYVKGQSAWFNSFDVHGAEAVDTMTWTLRVDGKFTDAFKEKLGVV